MSEGFSAVLRRNLYTALTKGEVEEARLLLERLQQEDPLSEETRALELFYLFRSDRIREAAIVAEQLLRLFPDSARIQHLAGRVAYREKDYTRAAERFRESQRIRPDWRSQWHLAKSLTQLAEYDEAASILEALRLEHAECYLDLAWLYERQEQYERALNAVENYLQTFPGREYAKAQQLRLRARIMDPQELVAETQSVLDFGEDVAESVIPQYLEALFRTGQAASARAFVAERAKKLATPAAVSAGWTCYRYQAFDLALDLFRVAFESQKGNPKFLAAIEFAAKRCGRISEILRLYETHAATQRHLFGRMRRLRRLSP